MIIGIPKGDLQETALTSLNLKLNFAHPRQLHFTTNDGQSILLVKTKDVATMVSDGEIDVGVACTAYYEEWELRTRECSNKLSYQIIQTENPWSVSLIGCNHAHVYDGIKIFTEFEHICRAEFPLANIKPVNGSVEGYVSCHKALGATIVTTGNTVTGNNLMVIKQLRVVKPCIIYREYDTVARKFITNLFQN